MEKSDIIINIKKNYTKFSKGQKLIATYIVNNYDKAAFMTAGTLGRLVGVSESTVVRFACMLGYDGYPDLQKTLQKIIKNKLTNVQRLNLMEGMNSEQIIDMVLKMDIANLRSTRENLDIHALEDAVSMIHAAHNIYVIGYRSSAPLSMFLSYYLSYVFDNVRAVVQSAGDVFAQLVHVKDSDVVIGIGFPRYSKQTVSGLEFAKARGAKIVSITDTEISPLYQLADICIFTKSDMNSFVDSLVAPLSIINALIIMLGLAKKDEILENFSTMEKMWLENNVYAKENFNKDPSLIEED